MRGFGTKGDEEEAGENGEALSAAAPLCGEQSNYIDEYNNTAYHINREALFTQHVHVTHVQCPVYALTLSAAERAKKKPNESKVEHINTLAAVEQSTH